MAALQQGLAVSSPFRNFWKHVTTYEAAVDGCAYGLRTEEGLMKKTLESEIALQKNIWHLQRLCTCEEPHVPCEGGNRTRASALYPKAMCQQVARIVKKIHEEQETTSLCGAGFF